MRTKALIPTVAMAVAAFAVFACIITDEQSEFRVTTIERAASGAVTIHFESCSEHLYEVRVAAEPGDAAASAVIATMIGQDGLSSHTDTQASGLPQAIYRVKRLTFGGDEDGDGLTNLAEYQSGTDINDYYNGVLPRLTIVGGNNQTNLPNTLLPAPIVVQVANTNGVPLTNAPVVFAVIAGGGGVGVATNGSSSSSFLQSRTGPGGQAPAAWLLGSMVGLTNRVTVTAFSASTSTSVTFVATAVGLPPDPSTVAPPVANTALTSLADATSFLYSGPNPIQLGVSPGVIDAKRAAVVRGTVLNRNGGALMGARVTVQNHPEYGYTFSRADGRFDMAVNGGGLLTFEFAKAGYLPVRRQLNVAWLDYTLADDVALTPLDATVATIGFGTSATQQVTRGTGQTDPDGTRQGTLLFPTGTVASVVLPGGTTQSVSSLNIRITEFTVGTTGPAAMPARLPPNSGYTYCVELSADEATAAGADTILFNQPVNFYVENFLGFPVGQAVPIGYYDHSKGRWVSAPNGRVIKILSIAGGIATLDTNGDNLADSAGQLAALGITDAERQRLATLYPAGQQLWRAGVTHFSPWDCNWPGGPPAGAEAPNQTPGGPPPDDSCKQPGSSTISAETQSFGEDLDVVGTPYRLHYESDRVLGNKTAYTIEIPLTEATLPPNVKRVTLIVEVTGRVTTQEFPATANQRTSFTWDGLDAYGRFIPGKQPITVRIGYVYDAVYYEPSSFEQAFAEYSDTVITANSARGEVTLWKYWSALVGQLTSEAVGLGGWTLDVHHVYDSRAKALYRGDGTRRTAAGLDTTVIRTFAGGGVVPGPSIGDGGPAAAAELATPSGVAVGPDGSVYISEQNGHRVRKVSPDGIISTIAGSTNATFCTPATAACGDGGPATAALLSSPHGVAVAPDGSVYIADRQDNRVRKVDSNGIIRTVAGTGTDGFTGDGGPATAAQLNQPYGVAVGPDGNLYIADTGNSRIRKVTAEGTILTVAGGTLAPAPGYGDGGAATAARLVQPWRVTFAPDGSMFIMDRGAVRVRRVGTDGLITTIAGAGSTGFSGDGGAATLAQLNSPEDVAVAGDGSYYVADKSNQRVRLVGTTGIITTFAGSGASGATGDGGPATRARLSDPLGLAVGPDGSVYVADSFNNRVRRIASALPGFSEGDVAIASEDGTQVYVFSNGGRHLRTLDALTQAVRHEFGYDGQGRLATITDGDSNVTTITRDGSGNPTGIVGPYSQTTVLTTDPNGYLASIANPASEQTACGYTTEGLLTAMTNPRTNSWSITYDSLGRLIEDTDPAGGFKLLSRTVTTNSFRVAISTALHRTNQYEVITLPTGGRKRLYTYPTGLKGEYEEGTDGSVTSRFPDGSVQTSLLGPDPRWTMLAPVALTNITITPGGLTNVESIVRSAVLTNANDLFSLSSLTETNTVNGHKYVSTYVAASRTLTNTAPSGRKLVTTYDTLMRPTREEIIGLQPFLYTYDSRGRISRIVQGSGAGARTNTFAYNPAGYLTNVTDQLARTVKFGYDGAGRIVSQTFPDNRVVSFTYDAAGNTTGITPPGRPAHNFAFTAVNLHSQYAPPIVVAGTNSTQYGYNLDRELTLVQRPDGQTIQYDYLGAGCNCGRLNSIIQPRGTNAYIYSGVTGLLTTLSAPDGVVLSYTHDGSLLTSETWSGPVTGSVSFAYDANFRVTTQTVAGTGPIAFQYDADSLLTQIGTLVLTNDVQTGLLLGGTLGSVADTWTYNGFSEPLTHAARTNGVALYSATYTRDTLGRLVGLTEILSGTTNVFTYAYGPAGRLTNVTQNAVLVAGYTYDSNDNRLSVTTPGGTTNGTYDAQDRLTQYGAATYSYTANGELKAKTNGVQVTSYQYDALGNLTAATLPDGTQIQYLIDGRNRRIGKKVNSILVQGFLYDGPLNCVAELDGTGAVVSRFVYGSRDDVPEYMVKGGVTYRLLTDHLGSVRLVANSATGAIAQRLDYDAFGQVLTDTAPGFQPFGYAGGLYDAHTKLVRFGARDYDPATGRWTAKDPIRFAGRQPNLFTYVGNDPINRSDASGLGQRNSCYREKNLRKDPPQMCKEAKYAPNSEGDRACALIEMTEMFDDPLDKRAERFRKTSEAFRDPYNEGTDAQQQDAEQQRWKDFRFREQMDKLMNPSPPSWAK